MKIPNYRWCAFWGNSPIILFQARSIVCRVGTWKIVLGNTPYKLQPVRLNFVKFEESLKKSGNGEEKLFCSRTITERCLSFKREVSGGLEREQLDKTIFATVRYYTASARSNRIQSRSHLSTGATMISDHQDVGHIQFLWYQRRSRKRVGKEPTKTPDYFPCRDGAA